MTNPQEPSMKSISTSASDEIDDFRKATPIVGIIGTTGCRQAVEMLFRNLPTDSGIAFVVVANIGKRKAKALPVLLQQRTDMVVDMATDGVTIAPDHVYIAPVGQSITVKQGKLSLQSPSAASDTEKSAGLLDHFLNSLADEQDAAATVVLLGGTGTDGVAGLTAIHKANGLIFIQDPEEAAHGALPRRGIAVSPDAIVASVGDLARSLVQNKGDLADGANTVFSPVTEDFEELYQPILSHIIDHTGHDLSHYKVATLRRRIARRMALSGVPSLVQYVALLEQNKAEAQALFQDSLVSVTSFFRDPDAYEMLERDCIPQLFTEKEGVDHVRVWVVGCATGQEAYSIAMQLVEYAAGLGKPPRLQVFATDLDENAIAIARRGIYPKAIAEEMTESRLGRFFSLTESGYQVKPEIREHVLFAVHNILKDPPFSNLDLITCRNVLIYFNREAQAKVFELFHYALNRLRPGREYLFLGTSESIDAAPELFAVLDKYCHLYQRCDVVSMPRQRTLPSPATLLYERQQGQLPTKPMRTIEELYAKWTLRVHTPPRLLVNSNYEITHIFGEVTRYLQEPEGAVTHNILQRILPVLRLDLRTALYQAFQQQERSISRALSVEQSGSIHLLQLHVGPITDPDFPKGFVEVVFVAEERPQLGQLMGTEELIETDLALVMRMEEELIRTRGRLQTIIEEYENSSQELKTSNEELQSINEELKSTTEELETSKEELQSMNEELVTVNGELTNKVEALNQANSDLLNLIASSDVGTIFLTVELRISRFTPGALDLFNLIEGDLGRPFAHITHHIRHSDIVGLAETVQKSGVRLEEIIQDDHGDWYLLRLFPYRTVTGTLNGVVISFVDINDLKRAESEERQRIQQQMLAGLGRHALANQNLDELFQTTAQQVAAILEMEFCKILEVLPGGENFRLRAGVGWREGLVGHELVPTDISSQAGYTLQVMEPVVVRDIRTETRFHSPKLLMDHGVRSGMTVTIYGPEGPFGALGVHSAFTRTFATYDIDYLQAVANTLGAAIARHRTATQLHNSEAVARRYVDMIQSAYDAIIVWHVDQGIEFWNRGAEELYGYSAAETIGQRTHELFQTKHPELLSTIMAILTAKGEWEGELSQRTKDGRTIYVSTRHQLITGSHGETAILEINRDITAAKVAEIALRQSEATTRRHLDELEAIYNTAPIGLCVMDRELRYLRINERLATMNGRPAADHIGRTGKEVLPDLAAKTDVHLQQVVTTGEPVIGIELTGEIPSQPGVEHTWIESWLPLFDEKGQVSAINIVVQEITERKKTEEALARSEERHRFLFENIDDGFCIVEIMLDDAGKPEDYRFLEANPSFERHTGLVNAIGKSARELIPNLEEHWIQIYGTIGLTGLPKRFEQGSEAMGRWYDVYAFRVSEATSPRVAIFFKDITDRRTAELQLQQSENHLRDVLNNLASFVGVMTPDGVLTEANLTALDAANLSAADVLGRHFAETYWWSYSPDTQAQLRTAIDQAVRGEIVRYDVRVRIKEEQFIIIDFMLAPIFDEDGQVQYLIPSGMDVTERRLVENALRQSEEQFRAVQQATPDGFMIFESVRKANDEIIDFRWIYVNPAAELITGRSRDDLVGKYLLEEMPGNREEGIFAAYVQVVESGEVWQHEFAYYHDGLQHWLRTTAAKTRDGLAVAFTDITPSKLSEEALRQSEMRFRSAFEQAAVGMAHLDIQGYYLRVNDRLCEILGYERSELVGKHFSTITHPDDLEADLAQMQKQLEGDLPHHVMEKRYLRKDGSYIWANMTASLVFNESAEPRYCIVVVEDISSRKAAEQALHELTTTLEDRVQKRTAELERSNRELDQFAYIASHDLRAPLRGINHLVDWITEDTGSILPPNSQKHLQTLRGRVRRMEQLLEDLLIYSRVGRHPTQVEWVNSVHLIEQLVELLQPAVPFEITVVDALPSFYTQRVPLELVLRNLINNAIKHHHRPNGQIQISAREQPNWVEFRVQDNGPGIAPEFHERIFQIFQTLHPRDKVEGSGMGLAVVKKTIESLGGEIGLESAEGEGATFFFTWPKYPAP